MDRPVRNMRLRAVVFSEWPCCRVRFERRKTVKGRVPVAITERPARAYAELSANVQKRVDKAVLVLEEDFTHPGLRARRVQGTEGIYEARVDRWYRMTYHRGGDRLVMRNVGERDKTLLGP